MLKRLLKRPALWSLLVLAGCAVWQLRPIDRSALFSVQFANGKYGYVNPDGRVVVPGVWDFAYSFAADGRALVQNGKKYSFIDRAGKPSMSPGAEVETEFSRRQGPVVIWGDKRGRPSNTNQLICDRDGKSPMWKQKPQKWGLRQNGKVIVEPVWDQIHPFDAAELAAVQKAGKWGFINRNQHIVIPLDWDHALPFAKNGLAVVTKDGRFGYMDRTGKIAIALEWDAASTFHDNGLARVRKDYKYGFIDQAGKIVIPLTYDVVSDFDHHRMAQVKIGERQGFVDPTGAVVIPLEWENIWDCDDVSSSRISDIELIDSDGQVKPLYREMEIPRADRAGLAIVRRNGKYGCINRRGEVIVDPEWDESFRFDDHGLARVSQNKKHGLINRKGELVIPPEWDATLDFDDKQMAVAQKGKKYGYIDPTGKIVLPIIWDWAGSFDAKNMAVVQRGERYGYIDRTGKIVLRLRWDEAGRFDSKDLAIVKLDGKRGCINRAGEIVVPLVWDTIEDFGSDDRAQVNKDKQVGFINRKGEILVRAEWDSLEPLLIDSPFDHFLMGFGSRADIDLLTPDILHAQRGKKTGYIDWAGNILVAPEWTTISLRTDAGAERCCFVVARGVEDDVKAGWAKTTRDWFLRLIGRAEQRNVLCHLYAADGQLLWSSDWISSESWSLVLAVLAGVVVIGDGVVLLRRRRGASANLAIVSEPRTK